MVMMCLMSASRMVNLLCVGAVAVSFLLYLLHAGLGEE